MMRIFPRSLLGQVMLVLGIGLIAGQAISAALLYRAAEQRREAALVHSLSLQIVASERREFAQQRRESRRRQMERMRARFAEERAQAEIDRRAEKLRMEFTQEYPFSEDEARITRLEDAVREVLAEQSLAPNQIAIVQRTASQDPFIQSRPRLLERIQSRDYRSKHVIVAAAQQTEGGNWRVIRQMQPPAPKGIFGSILLQTIITSLVLFLLLFLVIRRITRPLAQLTTRVDHFTRQPDRAISLEESGPDDVRKLIAAHNVMEARVASMIDEKDVMLGAIGHDLKTPLAALRVRIESVEDNDQRARMAQSIEDITATLDDILSLARVGRPGGSTENTDISALVAGIVEEYEDMEEPVELRDSSRVTAAIRPTWIQRATRNLISNGLRYGERARVDVFESGGLCTIRIDDDGPGIPDAQIAAMMEPFQRGEASRNRATGGAGLGLTLARAVAVQHGGTLKLSNRPEGGLRAELIFPTQ